MAEYYVEEQRVAIAGSYDVIVAGGGIAGISAALAARRSGLRVLLVEKSIVLGGLATLGFVAIYLPLCDGRGNKYVGGIGEELLRLSIKSGYHTLPPEWLDGKGGPGVTSRYRTNFNPSEFILAIDELMEDEGVDLLFDTVCCKLVMEGKTCRGVIVENKTGRQYYGAKVFVDTTGDLELMARAGASCATGENWLTFWSYITDLDMMKKAVDTKDVYAGIHLHWLGATGFGKEIPEGSCLYTGIDGDEITKFVLDGRRLLRKDFENSKGRERAVVALPGMPQFRSGRRLGGYYELTDDDVLKRFDDSIGCFVNFTKPGVIYEIPYRTLITPQMNNVITAGRSLSASGDAWVYGKVIPASAVTGQAAGLAAALAIEKDCGLAEISVEALQQKIANAGGILHI